MYFNDKKGLIGHGIITLAHLNPNSITWEHQSCLGPSMWIQHFKLKRHNSNHNPRTCKGDGSRNSYYQATTLPTNFFFLKVGGGPFRPRSVPDTKSKS